jgi:glutathione-regulated potassium-efflux system ancillary protein KefC/glutathione-regulated potassium-efflux system protein KefB
MSSLLRDALVYLAAGVISVPIAKRLGFGSVLGYLLAGVAVGPFALNLAGKTAQAQGFAEFGVVILLFLIGLEVRPALLWRMKTAIFGLGAAQMTGAALLLGAAAAALGLDWRSALAAGLILAMSSTAIVLQTLDEKGLRQGAIGEAAFGVLLFQDLSVIPLFALLPLLGRNGAASAPDHSLLAGEPGWERALAVMAAVTVVIFGGRYLMRPLFRFIAAARLREIFTASALLLVVSVTALMEVVGLSPALGAFLAGVVLAESEFRRELETDIEPFRGLLLGLFFITVGAGLDLNLVVSRFGLVAGLVVALMALKMLSMYGAARLFRTPRNAAVAVSVSLAQGGEFAFVLLSFAVGAQVLPLQLSRLFAAVIAVSMAATPLLLAGLDRVVLSRKTPREEPARQAFEEREPDVIVAGFGRFGQIAGRLMIINDFRVVTLESSIEQIDLLRRFGQRTYYGDASRLDLLRAAGAEKAKLLLVAIDDPDKAAELVEAAHEAFPNLRILARAYDRRDAYELLRRGATAVERETFESALNFGRKALIQLGVPARRALKSAILFREHDEALFHKLAPLAGEEERYILASRDSRETMERLLRAELARMDDEDETDAAAARRPVERDEAQV